ncbi:MAG TPA: hypothetical protein VMV94_12135 [Phycisphaerae bacterium]|nr:hypothetical protein [Phycisphaerae bacterium]
MNSSLHRIASLTGIVWLVAIVAVVAIGCGGMNPFSVTQFFMNSTLTDALGQRGPTTTQTTQPTNTVLASVCDLATGPNRTLQVTIENESPLFVKFSMNFLASTGSGGFVCDSEVLTYQNAGYNFVGTSNSAVFGCDTVLLGGERILAMRFGVSQGASGGLAPATVSGTTVTPSTTILHGIDGSPFIPLPQVIVFGSDDTDFPCNGVDLCTQRGFVYTTSAGVVTGKPVDASRIQGTICNTGLGTAPEWRLDTTLSDSVQLFQYTFGGSIVVHVLDRSGDAVTNTRNQVTWTVLDSFGAVIHNPNP